MNKIMITNYEMTEEDNKKLLDSCKPVPVMKFGGHPPLSSQENANFAWRLLGEKMGFNYMTVQPIQGKSARFFSAVAEKQLEE